MLCGITHQRANPNILASIKHLDDVAAVTTSLATNRVRPGPAWQKEEAASIWRLRGKGLSERMCCLTYPLANEMSSSPRAMKSLIALARIAWASERMGTAGCVGRGLPVRSELLYTVYLVLEVATRYEYPVVYLVQKHCLYLVQGTRYEYEVSLYMYIYIHSTCTQVHST